MIQDFCVYYCTISYAFPDCHWSEWGPWSSCNENGVCSGRGKRKRKRHKIPGLSFSMDCQGSNIEIGNCNSPTCSPLVKSIITIRRNKHFSLNLFQTNCPRLKTYANLSLSMGLWSEAAASFFSRKKRNGIRLTTIVLPRGAAWVDLSLPDWHISTRRKFTKRYLN